MSITTLTAERAPLPWIRNAQFDLFFIFGIALIALLTGAVVIYEPSLFYPILIIDLWILGYHHVISTFTRLCFDKQSLRDNRFLIFGLPPIIAVVTGLIAWQIGLWAIFSIYFYWQWWHYTRQSWGISRVYRAKDRDALYEDGWLDQAIFYAVPVFGIIWRSTEQTPEFLGLPLWTIHVSQEVADFAGMLAFALLVVWLARRFSAAMRGRFAVVHTFYMLTHLAIFATAYLIIPDITIGWLVINIWHNAQYILFVWMYNTKRFSKGIDPNAKFLSYISQPNRIWLYMITCIAITGVFYWGVLRAIDWFFFAGISATIVLYTIVNFHHYIVDSVIWKVRTPHMQKTLGIGH